MDTAIRQRPEGPLPRWVRGEQVVARHLRQLGRRGFLVLNDLRADYGNIDHLVVRPDGAVFLIETKAHVGTVTSDGERLFVDGRPFAENPLCQINCNIRWLRSKLKEGGWDRVWIVAVLVFPFAAVRGQTPFKRISIIGKGQLPKLMRLCTDSKTDSIVS